MLLSDVPLPLLLRLPCERCFFNCDGVRVTPETNVCERWIGAPPESATACPADDGGGVWCSCSVEDPRPSLETIRPKRPFGFSFGTGVCARGEGGRLRRALGQKVDELARACGDAYWHGCLGRHRHCEVFSPRIFITIHYVVEIKGFPIACATLWRAIPLGNSHGGIGRHVRSALRSSEDTGVALLIEALRFRPEPFELEPPNKAPEKLPFRLRERATGAGGTGSGISSRSRLKDLGSDLELAADRRAGLG
jgi:hypothetical protein